MKKIAAFLVMLQIALFSSPALAQDYYGGARTVSTESWIEEWDPATGRWVRVSDEVGSAAASLPTVSQTVINGTRIEEQQFAARYAEPVTARGNAAMLAQYGPFVVTSPTRAAMVGSTDALSPAQFDAMLRDFPGLAVLDMVEAPGTSNDIANLAVARRIRANGIATHVPDGGSVRSGAVELFLAGAQRTMDDGAMFAVHSWLDNHGREADDFPEDHPAHRLYLDFYMEMGMSEAQARGFYAMTNSVPHAGALWLRAADMRPWLRSDRTPAMRFAEARPVAERKLIEASVLAAAQPSLPALSYEWDAVEVSVEVPAIDYVDLSAVSLAQIAPSALTQG